MVPPPDNMGDEIPDFDSMSLEEQMAWLESLAKRQGASEDELVTDANLDVPVPENAEALIDEPGYVPFEGSRSAREMQQAQPEEEAAPPAEAAPPPTETPAVSAEVSESVAEPAFEETFAAEEAAEAMQWLDELSAQPEEVVEPVAEEPAPPMPEAAEVAGMAEAPAAQPQDVLGEAEPLEWMESLAKRQGASEEELITAADVEVPEVPEDTAVEEPGYQPYSALDILPPDAPEKAAISEGGGEDLSWLEDLAAEPDEEDMAAFLASEEEEGAETVQFETVEPEAAQAPAEPAASADPLAGMSDEEIARAQIEGRLTPQQELAWLKRQARALAEARETQEAAEAPAEVPPAEPAELPGWLEELRATEEMEAMTEADAVLADAGEIELEAEGLPDWLQTSETEEAQPADVLEVSLEEASEVESLWQEQDKAGAEAANLEEALPDSELAAFLSGDFTPQEPDQLAEALDEEYERRVSGDDTEPEWYAEAAAKVSQEAQPSAPPEPAQPPEPAPEMPLQEAEPLDMPDWLRGEEEAASAAPAEPAKAEAEVAMPDWLSEEAEKAPAPEAEAVMPDWLQDVEAPEPETAEALDWLAEEPEPETLPASEAAEPEAAPAPQAEKTPEPAAEKAPRPPSPSEEKLLEQYHERLREHADDYPTRLSLARALRSHNDIAGCLDHYETLVSAGQLLQDVTDDLMAVVEDNPEMPRAQRLLGDAYMRRGMLSEALEAYRRALAQL